MKIINDTIIFDDADVALFSAPMQKALQQYVGERTDPDTGAFITTPKDALNAAAAYVVSGARNLAVKIQEDNLMDLAAALAFADAPTKAQAQPFLDQAAAAVGITIKPQPSPVDPPIDEPPVLEQASAQRAITALKA